MKKIKTKNISQKIKVINCCTMVFLFLYCVFCFMSSLAYADTTSKQISDAVDKQSSHLLLAKSTKSDLSRQLWKDRISPAKNIKPLQSSNELRQIINQINSIELKMKGKTPEPLISVEPTQKTEHNEILANTDSTQVHKTNKTEHKLPYKQISDHTLQLFRDISQHPDKLDNPFELAEILFDSNCLAEARLNFEVVLCFWLG